MPQFATTEIELSTPSTSRLDPAVSRNLDVLRPHVQTPVTGASRAPVLTDATSTQSVAATVSARHRRERSIPM